MRLAHEWIVVQKGGTAGAHPGRQRGQAEQWLAQELNVSRPTVLLWRKRFQRVRVGGLLSDATRPDRRKKAERREDSPTSVEATLSSPEDGATIGEVMSVSCCLKRSAPLTFSASCQDEDAAS
jgi:hypothetical protein